MNNVLAQLKETWRPKAVLTTADQPLLCTDIRPSSRVTGRSNSSLFTWRRTHNWTVLYVYTEADYYGKIKLFTYQHYVVLTKILPLWVFEMTILRECTLISTNLV